MFPMSYLFLALTMIAWVLSAYHAIRAQRTSPGASASRSDIKNKYSKAVRSHRRRQILWIIVAIACAVAYLRMRQLEKAPRQDQSTAMEVMQ
jgi:hypothetical protein